MLTKFSSRYLPVLLSVLLIGFSPSETIGASEAISGVRIQSIEFKGVEGEVLENIRRHVRLVGRLKSTKPLSDNEQRRLQGRIKDEVLQAVEPFGFYRTRVHKADESSKGNLVYKVFLNDPVTVRQLDLQLLGGIQSQKAFSAWSEKYPLKKGDSLNHSTYESAKRELQATALRLGFFDAYYVESTITIDESRSFADIVVRFDSGKRYTVSNYDVQWLLDPDESKSRAFIDESLLDVLISVKPDEFYDIDTLTETQKALSATPYFSVVDVQPGEQNQSDSSVPVIIKLTPSKRKSYSFEVGVGTDTGIRGGIGYENRRINSKGHNLSVRFGGSQIERSANVNYRIPLTRRATDSLDFFATLEESDDFRDFERSAIGTQLSLGWKKSLLSFGLTASRERSFFITDALVEEERTIDLLMPSIGWQRTKVDDLYFPSKGWEASLELRAGSETLGSDIDLAQAIFSASVLRPFAKGRLKLRFKLAGSLVDEADQLPESLGFLTGGDDTVRGYRFESLGISRNGEIAVAKNEVIGSIEYQHPLKNELSLATFFDAGDAFDSGADYKRGVGVGLRWRLPFGALRFDLASALDIEGNPIRLHFGFGTDL